MQILVPICSCFFEKSILQEKNMGFYIVIETLKAPKCFALLINQSLNVFKKNTPRPVSGVFLFGLLIECLNYQSARLIA